MRKALPVTLSILVLLACKKNNDNPNEVNSADKNFLVQTYLSAGDEIRTGQLAVSKSNSQAIQNFGQKLVSEYQLLQTDIIAVANKLNYALSDTTTVGSRSISGLDQLSGYTFDTAYIQSRVKSQFNTLGLFQNELNNGNNTYVRYYLLNKHVDMVKAGYQEADSLSRTL